MDRKKAPARRGRHEGAPTNKEQRASGDRGLPGFDEPRLVAIGVSRREIAVLELVARGQTNEQIARGLRLSPLTVKKHLERMYGKLGVSNRAALVSAAWQRSRSGGEPTNGARGRVTPHTA